MAITTNVPAPQFSSTGFVPPLDSAILTGTLADVNAALGGNANPALTTPQGQIASSEAAIISNADQDFCNLTQQMDPAYSTGRYQDGIGRIYFIERLPALPTTLQVLCVGGAGVAIPTNALIKDGSGNLYACTAGGTIPPGGDLTLQFACTVPGPVPVPDSDDISIYQSIPGWDSVTATSGSIGQNVETRAAFEARREATVAGNAFGPVGSIIAAIANNVPGVLDYFGYSNNTASPVTIFGVTLPENNIYLAVSGGTQAAIGQAILSKLNPGPPMYGNTTVTAYDNNPLYTAPMPYDITFEIPGGLDVLFAVNIVQGPTVPSNAVALVQNAIINAFSGGDNGPRARIASLILASRFYAPIAALGSWAQVRTLFVGSSNAASATFDAVISGGSMTTSNASGTIAIGQTISDGDQYVPQGTTITAGSGSSWTISNSSITVAGASFTGNGSGTTLTVTGITGVLQVGNLIAGTGVPSGTTILEQLSGTTGGNGTYKTSNATTASSASITATQQMNSAVANNASVQVQADQEPSVSASNIIVTVS